MKITYYISTDKEHQDELQETVRRLFQVEPQIANRATDVNVDFAVLDVLVDLLNTQVIQTPHVVFTLDQPGTFSAEQQAFVSRPGVEVKRKYGPEEILYQSLQDSN